MSEIKDVLKLSFLLGLGLFLGFFTVPFLYVVTKILFLLFLSMAGH